MSGLVIRDCSPTDRAFVQNPWLEILKMNVRAHVAKQMANAQVRVACDPQDSDTLAGCVVYSGRTLHFVYVRQSLRNHGIARDLLASLPIDSYSWTTPQFERRIKPLERGWKLLTAEAA